MDINKVLKKYKKRMACEGLVKSALLAIAAGGISVFAVSLIYHLYIKEAPVKLLAAIFGIVTLVLFLLLFFVKYYPTDKKAATEIDKLGLKERVSTMIEFKGDERPIANLQRSDAEIHLMQTDPKMMKLKIPSKMWIACLISIILALVMVILPPDFFIKVDEAALLKEKQEQIVADLLEDLRQEIEEAPIEEELKEELNEIVDNLEANLKESDSELQKAAQIAEAREEIREAMEKAIEEAEAEASKTEGQEADTEALESEKDTLDEMLEEAMDEMLGEESQEGESEGGESEGEEASEGGESPGEEPPEGEMPEGEEPPEEMETPEQGAQGSGEEQQDNRTEAFYDPISGNVEYGKVYAAYYADYIEQLEKGDLPDDVKSINDKYYEALNEQ